jgi:4'-phosphopantetheinyl transferase
MPLHRIVWQRTLPAGVLPHSACHVWKVELDPATAAATAACPNVLNATELKSTAGFIRERDGARFAACRSALRRILGGYLNCTPGELIFHQGPHGRPFLAGGELDFNVTHSGDLALLAVCAEGPVGVDVEVLREVRAALGLSRRYFQMSERQHVEAALPEERSAIFLTCWTRKEAVLKSTGFGLALSPKLIDVGTGPEPQLVDCSTPSGPQQLRVISLAPGEGYVGACAVPASIEQFEFRRFDPPLTPFEQ